MVQGYTVAPDCVWLALDGGRSVSVGGWMVVGQGCAEGGNGWVAVGVEDANMWASDGRRMARGRQWVEGGEKWAESDNWWAVSSEHGTVTGGRWWWVNGGNRPAEVATGER